MSQTDLDRVRAEIERLHRFLTEWLNGTVAGTEDVLRDGMTDCLHPGFINIQPAGVVLDRETILDQIRSAHGRSPEFRILIRNVQLHHALGNGDGLLATYEEYQRGARNSARAENARLSTAVFADTDDGGLTWLHIHETWMPDAAHAPEHFDF